ncbi:Lrp/AsnC family transcriptional regulator [Kitasatospora sp. NBC_01250]|uniref:Lrp/AsnC family transcriptional regulator n=1 Tax=unclassified Kitasatospora TaxID=2633591 RepID=UPI002E0DA082|nr:MULTISPECIES: Lrp/AsnC family transcriptional regulator [unclassified Kitasatospora]WSJ71560.1 Lrp/AsnC family transcriptional regulator [Kitasatospora sp. NBC_01302]
MESDRYDDLDRQLVHSLQIDGRAPFSAIAAVLEVSDKTVARRYARLRSRGAVRVAGTTDPHALGEVVWFLRVRCAPDASVAVAEALARRSDTSWISLTSGGTEVVCIVQADSEQQSEALLLHRLPRTPRVEGITAHCVLHHFFGGPASLITKHGPLSGDQIARLQPPPARHRPGGVHLDADDQRLLAVLAADGRAGYEDLAAATGWSPSTVRRRMAELRECGALYFDVEYDWPIFGLLVRSLLWLSVAPAHLEATGRELAGHPEVAFVAATTGPSNLCASLISADRHALYAYLTTRIAGLPGITQVETAPVIRTLKRGVPRRHLP